MTARCQFITGDPRKPGFSFCGAPVERPDRVYCPTHDLECHRKVKRAPRMHKSPRPVSTFQPTH
jgi:hypothetical protein